jgi:prepilin-type N-terminal cleavage/methylation domain-containing protein
MRLRTQQKNGGFTLVEIMIVIAIIGGVLALGVPKMFSTASTMRAAIRKLAVITRDIRNNSRLYQVTTRLAISLDKDKGYAYLVESSPGIVLMQSELQEKELERLTEKQAEESKKKVQFSTEARVLKKPVTLPKGMKFEDVEKAGRDEAQASGMAYINFYPQGLSEEAAIHISDGGNLHWTIVINPLTGRADVYEKRVTLKELRGQ